MRPLFGRKGHHFYTNPHNATDSLPENVGSGAPMNRRPKQPFEELPIPRLQPVANPDPVPLSFAARLDMAPNRALILDEVLPSALSALASRPQAPITDEDFLPPEGEIPAHYDEETRQKIEEHRVRAKAYLEWVASEQALQPVANPRLSDSIEEPSHG